jgi:hypothetical protein
VFSGDAERYGWIFCNHIYSTQQFRGPAGFDSDVFFVGRAKNRLESILRVYERLTGLGLRCEFHILDVDEGDMRYTGDIKYNTWMPYRETLRRMLRSRCLLEILQAPGDGPTLRMVEAVVYNKKIITNDAAAPTNTYYDGRFMRVFSAPEEVDAGFIRDDIRPDYGYRGEYSADLFLKRIQEDLEDRKARAGGV